MTRAADSRETRGCGVLERGEGLILFEAGGEVLGGLGIELVVLKAAEKGKARRANQQGRRRALTVAADTYQKPSMCDAPDGLQRGIHLEHVDDRDDALGSVGARAISVDPTKCVVIQAASKGHKRKSVSTVMGC